MKVSLKSFTKRLACFFSAFMIAVYTLVSAPCFGVHATSLPDLLKAAADWVVGLGQSMVDTTLSGGSLPNAIISYCYGSVVGCVTEQTKASMAEQIDVSVDLTSLVGDCQYADVDGLKTMVSLYSWSPTTWTYNADSWFTDFGVDHYMPVYNAVNDDYKYTISLCPVPVNTESPYLWNSGDYITASTDVINVGGSYRRWYRFIFSFYNSSGTAVSRPLKFLVKVSKQSVNGSNSSSSSVSYTSVLTSNSRILVFKISSYSTEAYSAYSFDSLAQSVISGPGTFTVAPSEYGGLSRQTVSSFPTSPGYTTISNQNVYDYVENVSYPYIVNTYPEYNTIINPPSYYIPEEEETTEPSTGDGTIIIIDPFTLPPEWVESDVVELDTQSYTIDYDTFIDAPVDELNVPLSPDNPLHGGSNILAYGIQFLKDGGVFYILLSLLLIGIFIRFLGI